jgi:hypothetical protein
MIRAEYYSSSSGYCCQVRNQAIFRQITSFPQDHKPGQANNDVKVLVFFSNCKFQKFPENISDFFPNLTKLSVEGSEIKSLKRKHFKGLRQLTDVIFNNCGLTTLSGDLFKDSKNIRYISFRKNKLERIDANILDELEFLTFADFIGNTNIDMCYLKDDHINSLQALKNEIALKCNPKINAEATEPLARENEALKAEIEVLNGKLNALEGIFADDVFKDFTINVGEASFKVHKTLFIARSSTLAEILRKNPEAEELNLQDIPEDTFQAIHDFIYTSKLPEGVNNMEVFAAAGRLKIENLKEVAAEHLLSHIDETNAYDVLVFGNKFAHDELIKKAFEVIKVKIFKDHNLRAELAEQPEKLKELIDAKRKIDREYEELQQKLL